MEPFAKNPSTVNDIYNIDLLNFVQVNRFNSFIAHINAKYLKDILGGGTKYPGYGPVCAIGASTPITLLLFHHIKHHTHFTTYKFDERG